MKLTFSTVWVQESLAPGHGRELLGDPLEHVLDGGRVDDEGGRLLQTANRDVVDGGHDVVGDPLDKAGRVLVLEALQQKRRRQCHFPEKRAPLDYILLHQSLIALSTFILTKPGGLFLSQRAFDQDHNQYLDLNLWSHLLRKTQPFKKSWA